MENYEAAIGLSGPLLWLEYGSVFLLRPLLAISFVLSVILLSWLVAWKSVLVHVPLVQEIFGLRKKTSMPKPPNRHRISRFYNSNPSSSATRTSRKVQEERS